MANPAGRECYLRKLPSPTSRKLGPLAEGLIDIVWWKDPRAMAFRFAWTTKEGESASHYEGTIDRELWDSLPDRVSNAILMGLAGRHFDHPAAQRPMFVALRSLYAPADEWNGDSPPALCAVPFPVTMTPTPKSKQEHEQQASKELRELEQAAEAQAPGVLDVLAVVESARYVTEPVTMSASEMVEHLQAELSRARRNHAGCEFVQRDLSAGIKARDTAIEKLQCELDQAIGVARANKGLVADQRKTIEGLISRAEAAEKRVAELLVDLLVERERVAERDRFVENVQRDVIGSFTAGKKCECGKWVEIGNASATALAKPVRERGLVIRCQSQVDPDE